MKVTLRTDLHMERATTKILIKHIQESGEMILSMDLGNKLWRIKIASMLVLLLVIGMKEKES